MNQLTQVYPSTRCFHSPFSPTATSIWTTTFPGLVGGWVVGVKTRIKANLISAELGWTIANWNWAWQQTHKIERWPQKSKWTKKLRLLQRRRGTQKWRQPQKWSWTKRQPQKWRCPLKWRWPRRRKWPDNLKNENKSKYEDGLEIK